MGKGGGCVPSKKRQPPATTVAAAPSSSSATALPRDAPEEALDAPTGESGRKLRLYIVFYSMYGHVEALARHAAAGAGAVDGVEVVLRRVPETLSPEVLEKMQAPAKDSAVPVISAPADLEEADGVLFGFPTRYGAMAAQMKAFFDSTGSLWEKQRLAGKPAGFFVSTGTQGGGQETTALNLSRAYAIKSSSVGSATGLCLGQCRPLSCKCKLGWSSQPPPDLRHRFTAYSSASEAVLTAQSDIRKLFVANGKIGVLLLNLGGPETLDDVQPFLFNLFADPDIIRLPRAFRFLQKPLAQFISVSRAPKSKEGYASIGGGSPLRQITDAQGEALMKALCGKDIPAKVYVGMRYWHPFIEEAIEQIKQDGITKLVVLPLYPQFSISTSGSSLRLLESIFREDEYLVNMQHTVIPSWYQREGYIKAMATLIEKELLKFPKPQKVMIFFSAHGVPLAYVEEAGDPYKAEMEECVDLIMEELEQRGMTNPCTLAYQSRVGPVEWLKPYTDETIIALGQRGVKSLLAVPISFVSEHIETLEEIDVEYKELALKSGIIHWGRVPALGCEPTFISDLADAVIESLPYVGAMAVSNLEARQSLVPLGSVEELLAAYDSKRDMLPPPVIVWEWGWTKSAETWNGRAAMLAVLALLVLEVTTGHGFLHQWGILPPLP